MNTEKLSEWAAKRIAEIAADVNMNELEKANRIITVIENDTETKIGLVLEIF